MTKPSRLAAVNFRCLSVVSMPLPQVCRNLTASSFLMDVTLRTMLLLLIALGMDLTSTNAATSQLPDDPAAIDWAKPDDVSAQLRSKVSVLWSDRPLIGGLETFQSTFGVPIVNDRRVNPHRRITARVEEMPLEDAIAQAVEGEGLEAVAGNWGILVAPVGVADRALTTAAVLRASIEKLPAAERRRLTRTTPASWPRLSEPRALVQEIATSYGVDIAQLDRIPHDVWPARQLPELDMVDRLGIILSSFDLAVRWIEAGARLEIVPLPERISFASEYLVPANRRAATRDLEAMIGSSALRIAGNKVEVDGLWHVHRQVQKWLLDGSASPARGTGRPAGESRLTLNAESAPLGDVIRLLEERLELTFEWSDEAMAKRDERVPLRVQDVTIEQLLEKITSAAGLTYRLEGKRVQLEIAP